MSYISIIVDLKQPILVLPLVSIFVAVRLVYLSLRSTVTFVISLHCMPHGNFDSKEHSTLLISREDTNINM